MSSAQKKEWELDLNVEVTWGMIAQAVMLAMGFNPDNGMKLNPRNRRIGKARVFLEAVVERANKGREQI